MSYAAIYTAATDAEGPLRKQVAVAIHKAAVDVRGEDPQTANHTQRRAWSRLVLESPGGPARMAETMIWAVLENATIQAAPTTATDSDVQFVVNSLINTFAGA
jgi:hypothetical protein